MPTLLFTGFPGFLCSELLPRILLRDPDARAVCLVQPKFAAVAVERVRALVNQHPILTGRIELVDGDITRPLDLPSRAITEIFHLAAIYDLSVPRALGLRVNVDGTRNVLDFASLQRNLSRLHYISTCYVSGRFDGLFHESDLAMGQTFNNAYEETKYLAEIEVRRAMTRTPLTIYRPSVVVGDATTGATQKYDGPYYVMQWILRQETVAFLPVVGNPKKYRFNVVPRDFIVAAIAALSALPASRGMTYHLADPDPLTVDETITAIGVASGRTIVRIPLTRMIARKAIEHLPGVERLLRIPSPAVDYFVHPTRYDTSNAQNDLAAAGVAVPRFRDYLPRLLEFVREHPEIGASGMA